jgi:hypothetical protein
MPLIHSRSLNMSVKTIQSRLAPRLTTKRGKCRSSVISSWLSERSLASVRLKGFASVSARSKLCQFSIPITSKVARPRLASMVGLWGEGPASFCFRGVFDRETGRFHERSAFPLADKVFSEARRRSRQSSSARRGSDHSVSARFERNTKKLERRKFATNPVKMEISFAIITGADFAAMTKAAVATSPPAAPNITNLK